MLIEVSGYTVQGFDHGRRVMGDCGIGNLAFREKGALPHAAASNLMAAYPQLEPIQTSFGHPIALRAKVASLLRGNNFLHTP